MRRFLGGVVAAVLFLLSVAAGGALIRTKRLGDTLVNEANARSHEIPRPVHRLPPVGTTFQTCLARVLDSVPDAGMLAVTKPEAEVVRDVLQGRAELAKLSTSTVTLMHRDSSIARQALACSRAPLQGEPQGLGLGLASDSESPGGARLWQFTRLALLEARELIRDGHPDEALELCGDAIAFSRDLAYDMGLVGASFCGGIVRLSIETCGVAIDRASEPAKSKFLAELAVIRRGLPSFADVLDTERVEGQLFAWGEFLSEAQLGRLPVSARRSLGQSREKGRSHSPTMFLRWLYWSEADDRSRRLVTAARLPVRHSAIAAIGGEGSLLRELLGELGASGSWRIMLRYDKVPLDFDLLESAARVDLGLAPTSTVATTHVDGGGIEIGVEWAADARESIIIHPDSTDAG